MTALASIRAGRAKDDQLKSKDAQIALLEQLAPARLREHIDGYKTYYDALLEQTKGELSHAEEALTEARKSKALSDAQLDRLRKESQLLQSRIRYFQARLSVTEQASRAVAGFESLTTELWGLIAVAFEKRGFRVARADASLGADLLLTKEGLTTVVEVKDRAEPVGAEAIQQVALARDRRGQEMPL